METIRALKQSIANFCLEVVQWRHFCTIPYLVLLNFSYCVIAFYATNETQILCLYGIVGCVLSSDLLLSSTHDHSVIREIFYWPFQSFFKTACVLLCSLAVYELKHEEKEEAFVSSCTAVCCLIVYPLYKYHQVYNKICAFLNRVLAGLKELTITFIAVPLLWFYDWATYIICFRWLPGLRQYLHTCWLSLYHRLGAFKQYLRVLVHKMAETCKYFLYFYWFTDLRKWANRAVIQPVLEVLGAWFNIYIYKPLKSFLRKVVYVLGCYWLVPVVKEIGRRCAAMGKKGVDLLKQASVALCQAFGLYVLQPVFALVYAQLCVLSVHIYRLILQPVIDICYTKYKFVEDMIFINVLGPLFNIILRNVPEKNPFCDPSDTELNDFLPESIEEDGEASDGSEMSHTSLMSSNDEKQFLPKGLNKINISGSDSSDSEFLIHPKSSASSRHRRSQRRPTKTS